jgi:putative aminopeptidase FrvX
MISLWIAAVTLPAQAPQDIKDGFLRCATIPSVTGREGQFVEFLKSRLPAGVKPEVDNMGNMIVRIGSGDPQILIVTSIDEPGYLVTDITEEGFLRILSPGGRAPNPLFLQFHEGHYVDIGVKTGPIRGVVALPSSHLVRGRRESLALDKALIDIGARSKSEAVARGIELLEPVTAVKDIALLAENRIAGPMLSRKFGAFALLESLKANAAKPGKSIVFAWACQSVMSNSGLARLAREVAAKQIVIVGAYQRAGGRGGRDPVEILDSGVLVPDTDTPGVGSPLFKAAAAAAVPIKLTPSPGGTLPEARAFGSGADLFAVGIPVAFAGSLVETIDLDDLRQLITFLNIVAAR